MNTTFVNLDPSFATVMQGIMIFVLETQNVIIVNAIRSFLSSYFGSVFCT